MNQAVNKFFLSIYAVLLLIFVGSMFIHTSGPAGGLEFVGVLINYFFIIPIILVLHLFFYFITKPSDQQTKIVKEHPKTSGLSILGAIVIGIIISFILGVVVLAIIFYSQ